MTEYTESIPSDLGGQLALLEALVERITAPDPLQMQGFAAAEASSRVHAAQERLSAQRLGWIARIESDGLWALDTMWSFASWLAKTERLSPRRARQDIAAARALRDYLPATGRAVRRGDLTTDHLGIMAAIAGTSEQRREKLRSTIEGLDPAEIPRTPDEVAALAEYTGTERDVDPEVDANSAPPAMTGEELLLAYARVYSLPEFTRVAKRFAVVTDPESDDRGFRAAQDREFLEVSGTLDGYHVSGFLTEEHGQLLKTALGAVMGRPAEGDHTPAAQRRAIALAGLARIVLDKGLVGTGAAVRPHLSVLVPWVDLQKLAATCAAVTGEDPDSNHSWGSGVDGNPGLSGISDIGGNAGTSGTPGTPPPSPIPTQSPPLFLPPAPPSLAALLSSPGPTWEDGRGPVPDRILRRIVADCLLTRIVFGPDSQILDVGRSQRTLTGARRAAVIARDRHCVWPGCDMPPEFGQIHHAQVHWADGGSTSTTNAALLCWHHHEHVDGRDITMQWNNGWTFGEPGSYGAVA